MFLARHVAGATSALASLRACELDNTAYPSDQTHAVRVRVGIGPDAECNYDDCRLIQGAIAIDIPAERAAVRKEWQATLGDWR
jgi:hypothetical protein